jgi:hypothetical protein
MTSDLFGPIGAELAQNGSAPIRGAYSPSRIGAIPPNGAEMAPNGIRVGIGAQGAGAKTARRPRKKTDRQDLLRQQADLVYQESVAALHIASAQMEAAPFETAFHAATAALLNLHARRKAGLTVSKATMLAAYDVRVEAGHAWNTPRNRLKEAQGWHKRIKISLLEINAELGS